ncbi:hypothetical protein QTP88_017828 [Uroleucon formosanum]
MPWKFSVTILVPKPNKPPDISTSFRPISLLPFFSKILERLILKRILPYISSSSILPNTQFGFRTAHSTIHQLHRLVDAISFSLEKKVIAPAYSWIYPKLSIGSELVHHYRVQQKSTQVFLKRVSSLPPCSTFTLRINPPLQTQPLRNLQTTKLLSQSTKILT